jgi:hypothetical protein
MNSEFDVLKWAVENRCPYDKEAMRKAAMFPHMKAYIEELP